MYVRCNSFSFSTGFYVPFIYLIAYARDIGIEPKEGAFLLSIIGISNTIARILCGYVSDKRWADPLKIYNWALIIGGVATICTTWLTSFALLSCYACIFGLCLGKSNLQVRVVLRAVKISYNFNAKFSGHFPIATGI